MILNLIKKLKTNTIKHIYVLQEVVIHNTELCEIIIQ